MSGSLPCCKKTLSGSNSTSHYEQLNSLLLGGFFHALPGHLQAQNPYCIESSCMVFPKGVIYHAAIYQARILYHSMRSWRVYFAVDSFMLYQVAFKLEILIAL